MSAVFILFSKKAVWKILASSAFNFICRVSKKRICVLQLKFHFLVNFLLNKQSICESAKLFFWSPPAP